MSDVLVDGSEDFLIIGVTIAFLNSAGTTPSGNEQLTSLVIEGSRISIHSLTRNVGHGSNRQDLQGDFVIIFSNFLLRNLFKAAEIRHIRWGRKGE